jgi:hypothetical protein
MAFEEREVVFSALKQVGIYCKCSEKVDGEVTVRTTMSDRVTGRVRCGITNVRQEQE